MVGNVAAGMPRPGSQGPPINSYGIPDTGATAGGGRGAKAAGEMQAFFGPERLATDTLNLYKYLAGNPMFAQILKGAGQAGQTANTGIQSALGRTGLSSSGIGAVTGGLGQSLAANNMNQARAGLFNDAQQQALQLLMGRLGNFPGLAEGYRGGGSFWDQAGQTLLGGAAQVGSAYAGRPRVQ